MEFGSKNTYAGPLHENDKEQKFDRKLKDKALLYPSIYEEAYDESTYLCTRLRIRVNEVYYLVVCRESAKLTPSFNKLDLYKRFIASIYVYTITLPQVVGYNYIDIDPNQEDEKERVQKLNFY